MKKCTSCQTIQGDINNFCRQCGAKDFEPLVEQESPESKESVADTIDADIKKINSIDAHKK